MQVIVILHNIEKNTNLGQLIRTCNALGVEQVCVVGRKKYASYGNKNTHSTTPMAHFFTLASACEFYRGKGYHITAVEITPTAQSINSVNFRQNTVFVMGNEGVGLPAVALALCDSCVYIPQFGEGASINVNVACGVVLNTFMAQAGRVENTMAGEKFVAKSLSSSIFR